jgi:hypothetical protein
MKGPVTAQFLVQTGWERQNPVLVSFAVVNEELVLRPLDVVDGQGQAFVQAQAAGVDQLDRGAIATQSNVGE